MKKIKELVDFFYLRKLHWGTKFPKNVTSSMQIEKKVKDLIISESKDEYEISNYAALMVACLEQNGKKIGINSNRISGIMQIQINSSIEDLYILLLALETYCEINL